MKDGMQGNGHMTPDPHKVGELVLKTRLSAGLTQTTLAAKVSELGHRLSQAKVTAIERGKQLPSAEVAEAMMQLLPGLDLSGFAFPHGRMHGESAGEAPRPKPVTKPREPEPPITKKATRDKNTERVADYPRVTVYLDTETKALLDASAKVLNLPAYQLITDAFMAYLGGLPPADRRLIEELVARRRK